MPDAAADADELMHWARRVALSLAGGFRLRRTEMDDVISEAQLHTLQLVAAGVYDPVTYPGVPFRAWAYRRVRTHCVRFVQSMRGGGTFRTARPENVRVVPTLGKAVARLTADPEPEPLDCVTVEGVPIDVKVAPDPDRLKNAKAKLTALVSQPRRLWVDRDHCPRCQGQGTLGYVDGEMIPCRACVT
jgi:hypothetical protein